LSDMVESYIFSSFTDDTPDTPRKKRAEDKFVSMFESRGEKGEDRFVSMFDDQGRERKEEEKGREAEEEEGEEEAETASEEEEVIEEPVPEPVDVEAETRKIFEGAFAQGEKAGYEMGLQRVEPLVKRLNHYISALEEFKDELMKRSESLSAELALIFAEAVVLRTCDEKREIVAEMVRKALDIFEGKGEVTIRIRPDDAEYISGNATGRLKIVPDDSIREPGFVIETNFGDIDGRISTQLDELKKRIFE
jgi:flagellar assembly protein FliH